MTFRTNAPTIPLDTILWDECGDESDPAARLLAHIRIGPVDMHLEAWAIEETDGEQVAGEATLRADELGTLQCMMDTAFTTLDLNGRSYVLIATPYGL